VTVFVGLTVSLLVVLPALFLWIDWPGWEFAAALLVGQAAVIGLHSWWFRRSLRHSPTRPPRGYLVLAAVVGSGVLCLGLISGPLGSVWALGAAILLGDCLAGRARHVVVLAVCVTVVVGFGLGALLAPAPPGEGRNWVAASIVALYLAVLWTASVNRGYWLGSLTALDRSRRNAAELAVARERLRLADDLHDILGHALEVVAFKSELAAKLLPPGAQRARTEIDEVARVAREAMSDVRALARGRRTTTLTAELAGARATLGSAGIALSVTGDPTTVPDSAQDVLGRVLREAMTNLLRHATATRCTVTVTHGSSTTRLLVVNDGATDPAGALVGQGTGLRGLERYLTEQDGHLSAAPSPDGTFTVAAELPAAAVRT
jgi:two-component system sensor histidine kinase DesK